ncbi:hypothetical protein BJF92_11815 [Rhizobium rhizosphaerae]|uniref:Transglutaminase-like superfamily protein n=1 Tax=Xaviernesmea rhizosphaerae TaxID=1672749 RepID=A0A1Q9AMW9_9HYPH|nr:DUF3857 domain-containing protein [Xaviernesmea rhizosphaerae]OLP56757.1 hypothetical protein BJF92_11815 [Xaviernesmea rhizosphaerae]
MRCSHPFLGRVSLGLALLLLAGTAVVTDPGRARSEENAPESDRSRHEVREYRINPDLTMESWITIDETPIKPGEKAENTRHSLSYSPETETLDVAEAWTVKPDGTRMSVPPEDIFTRSKEQSKNAPGFNADQKVTVLFPQVGPGTKVHIRWHTVRRQPQLFGVNILEVAPRDRRVEDETVLIDAPADLALRWFADPGIETEDRTTGNRRVIRAHLTGIPKLRVTYPTVADAQFRPRFMATTLTRLEENGDRIAGQTEEHLDPATAERVKHLADSIVGEKKGLDAAAAIHDWIRQNIAYTALDLNPNDGWVEHPVGKILDNGFGDCKDQSALMRALLQAEGIRAERAVVQWGSLYEPMPIPVAWQFNHVIVYLPDFDLFDNPTDKQAPFATLDDGLVNKQAMIIGKPSRLMRLPDAQADKVHITNRSDLTLGADGTLTGHATVTVSPWAVRYYQFETEDKAAFLTRNLASNGQYGEGKLTVKKPASWRDDLTMTASWTAPAVVDLSQTDAVLPLQAGFDTEPLSGKANLLHTDVKVAPFTSEVGTFDWNMTIALPEGFKAESLPASVHLANPAGQFDSTVEAQGNRLVITRRLVMTRLVTAPKDYPELKALMSAAVKAGRSYAILTHLPPAQRG